MSRLSPKEPTAAMSLYEVIFRTSPVDDSTEDVLLDELDAMIATHGDVTLITVTAEAACGIDAAMMLIQQLQRVGVTVHRVEKDLVNAAAIASRCGETRAAVTNYIRGTRRAAVPFPAPEVSGSPSLWRWPDVNMWLAQVGKQHDSDVNYLSRDEESQVDHRLCVLRRAARRNFTAIVTGSVTSASTPPGATLTASAMVLVS